MTTTKGVIHVETGVIAADSGNNFSPGADEGAVAWLAGVLRRGSVPEDAVFALADLRGLSRAHLTAAATTLSVSTWHDEWRWQWLWPEHTQPADSEKETP